MSSEALLKYGDPQLVFCSSGTFAPTAANDLRIDTPTVVAMDFTSLGASGGGRQSAKTASLGKVRAPLYRVDACLEFVSGYPAEGAVVDFYWAGSHSQAAGTANGGGVAGTDSAYTADTAGALAQLTYIGSLVCRAGQAIQIGEVGVFSPQHLYGTLVAINNTAVNCDSDAIQQHVTLTPLIFEAQ